jgi:hypothetical protein
MDEMVDSLVKRLKEKDDLITQLESQVYDSSVEVNKLRHEVAQRDIELESKEKDWWISQLKNMTAQPRDNDSETRSA